MKKSPKCVMSIFLAVMFAFGPVQFTASASIFDDNSVKICLVGNSYLAYGDFGEKLERIAESEGNSVKIIDLTKGANEGMITNQLSLLKTERGRLEKLQSADIVILQLRVGFKISEYEELLSYLDDDVKVYATSEPTAYLSCLNSEQMERYWNESKKPTEELDFVGMACKLIMPINETFRKLSDASDNEIYLKLLNTIADVVYKYIEWILCTGEYSSFELFDYVDNEYGITDYKDFIELLEKIYNKYGSVGYGSTPELCFRTIDEIDAFIPNGYIFDKLISDYNYSFFDIRKNDSSAHATEFSAYAFALAAYSIIFDDSPLGVDAFLTNIEYRKLPTFGIRSKISKDEVKDSVQIQVDKILNDYNQKAQELTDSIEFNSEKGFYVKKSDSVLTYVY